ncbi:MAG: S9 family peptidase [Candidatus Eremiobacteraeota bacterium]|nr:S9 family peptidase [Candidatus Eremiobacteraeota bacterium]
MIQKIVSIAACLTFSVCAPASAAPLAAEDLFKMSFVSDPEISPDGKQVVFVVSRMNGPENRYDTNLWIVATAGGSARELTTGGRDSSPAWSPDSERLAFVRSAKKARPQIYVYDFRTKRIRRLTNLKGGAQGPLFSNHGGLIAFSANSVDPPMAAQIDFRAAGFQPKKNQRHSDVGVINTMHFQANGAGEIYRYHRHIWIMNADGSRQRALTSGPWNEGNYAFSPDDRALAFDSLQRDAPTLGESDIYTIPVLRQAQDGGATQLLSSNQLSNNSLGFGHTSNRLWYFSGGVTDPAEYAALVSSRQDGSDRRELIPKNTDSWGDAVITDTKEGGGLCGPWFAPNDAFLVMNVDGPGYSKIVKLDSRSGAVSDLTSPSGEAFGCTMSADGRTVAYAFSDFLHPAEVYAVSTTDPHPHQLTSLNASWLRRTELSTPQPFAVRDSAGFTVQAWFMPAIGPHARGPRPTLLDIHGGPETQFGNSFFAEFQYWAGLGYNVVFSDPRGSPGFGYAFEEALVHHWGDAMFEDVSNVMDAVSKRPDVDANRLGVLGGSYGGYATLWVVSHTNRFKAAIAERAVSDVQSEQLAADLASTNALGGMYDWGMPWEPRNAIALQSPLTYVNNVHTPLLLLHSTEDTRTPVDQTLQEFSALKILGRPVQYVEFPGENHDLSRTGGPIHRVERLHILADFMARYLHP